MTRWRQRMGEEKLAALVQESLASATRAGAAKPSDFAQIIVDTTVQPKAIAFPTDAKLIHRARERLVRLAQKHGVRLRQSYARVRQVRVDQASALRARQAIQARQ
jgi:IS5 family transposase